MTTDAHRKTRDSGLGAVSLRPGVLGGVFLATLGVGAVLVGLAALVGGADAALGALTGAGLVAAVLAFGTVSLSMIARVMPAASLMAALMTYLVQVLLLLLVAIRLSETTAFGDGPGRTWLGIGIALGTVAWAAAQVVLTARARIPIYELPPTPSEQASDESRTPAHTGGER
jgi:ATP synthase protein I